MFCKNCGNQVPDEANVCPNCGTVLKQNPQQPKYTMPNHGSGNDSSAVVALACGITGIVVAVLGGILFGIFGGIIGIILGVVAVVAGTNAKKASNNAKGTGGFICGLLALIFGVVFTAGCGICGCTDPTGYTCYGCVGGSCKASNDIVDGLEDYYDALLDDFNW